MTPLDPTGQVVVVEGTLDALAIAACAASAGRLSEFAPITSSGLAYSDTQLRHIASLTSRPVVLALDGDTHGQKNNDKTAAGLARMGCQSAIVDLPEDPSAPIKKDGSPAGHDPASWLAEHGPAGLDALVRSGGEAAPADEVRPRPSHARAVAYLAANAPRGHVVSTVLEPVTAFQTCSARQRYLAAAAPVVVNAALAGDREQAARRLAATSQHVPDDQHSYWQHELVRALNGRDGCRPIAAQLQTLAPTPTPNLPSPEPGRTLDRQ